MKLIKLKAIIFLQILIISLSANALTITTWNLEHLIDLELHNEWRDRCNENEKAHKENFSIPYCNALNGLSFPAKKPESLSLHNVENYKKKIDLIKKELKNFNSDIYAFQEVSSVDALKLILDENQYNFYISDTGISQEVAFAIKKKIENNIIGDVQDFETLSITEGSSERPTRNGLELNIFHNGAVLSLLNIHLKSSCSKSKLNDPNELCCKSYLHKGCRILKHQVEILEEWLHKKILNTNIEPIILGDFNRVFPIDNRFKGSDSMLKELSDDGYDNETSLWATPYKYSKKDYNCHNYDYFLTTKDFSGTIGGHTISKLPKKVIEQAKISDHCPITIKLK